MKEPSTPQGELITRDDVLAIARGKVGEYTKGAFSQDLVVASGKGTMFEEFHTALEQLTQVMNRVLKLPQRQSRLIDLEATNLLRSAIFLSREPVSALLAQDGSGREFTLATGLAIDPKFVAEHPALLPAILNKAIDILSRFISSISGRQKSDDRQNLNPSMTNVAGILGTTDQRPDTVVANGENLVRSAYVNEQSQGDQNHLIHSPEEAIRDWLKSIMVLLMNHAFSASIATYENLRYLLDEFLLSDLKKGGGGEVVTTLAYTRQLIAGLLVTLTKREPVFGLLGDQITQDNINAVSRMIEELQLSIEINQIREGIPLGKANGPDHLILAEIQRLERLRALYQNMIGSGERRELIV